MRPCSLDSNSAATPISPAPVRHLKIPPPSHTVTIQGGFEDTFGRHTQQWTLPARKPTGTYLAPGTIATVTVPQEIVNLGYHVRVGAHSWDLSTRRNQVRRLDRATTHFPIQDTTIKVASPYGGGIYIEVPFNADASLIDVTVTGAVRAPYFSAKSFHQTTAEEWLVERTHPAPWADFQSDKFMMQVPTNWIYAHPDPAQLMADWDAAMDAQNDLMGFPRLRGKETMYCQVDVIMRSSVHAPGYPAINVTDNPNNNRGGYHNNYLVRGPGNNYHSANIEIHEQGHAYFFPKFGGETESTVNLPHVAAMHRKFGYSLDEAFRGSLGVTNPHRTLDNTAIAWMCVFNFSPRNVPMATAEKAYQLKGHAKFVDIARLFGWDGLGDYWRSFMEDDANGASYSDTNDEKLLRLSRHVGHDIRPLFHFWGIFPQNPAAPVATWAESFPDLTDPDPTLDFDGGGLATALEWVLGSDPTDASDDMTILPTIDTDSDPDGKMVFTFRRNADANADPDTTIVVEYGSDLAGWTAATHQGAGAEQITITATPDGFGDGIDAVTVAIPVTLAGDGKLFVRLNVEVVMPVE